MANRYSSPNILDTDELDYIVHPKYVEEQEDDEARGVEDTYLDVLRGRIMKNEEKLANRRIASQQRALRKIRIEKRVENEVDG